MSDVSILGIGPVCALGCGVAQLREGLMGARQPRIESRELELPGGLFSLPVYTAVSDELERFVPKRSLRRMDPFVRMALLAAYLAVEDAGIVFSDPERVGVVVGSGYGPLQTTFAFQDSLIDFGDKCASPTHFANSVHNALASQISIAMGLRGPGQTVTTFGLTTAGALLTAQLWLERGEVDHVLVGAGDEFCAVRGHVEAKMLAEAGQRENRIIESFAFDACTYTPGEGFVVFVLGTEKAERRYAGLSRVVVGTECLESEASLLGSLDAVILAANGNRAEGAAYRRLARNIARVAAYSPLYGSMPTGDAFDVAIAALSLKEGRVFALPDARGADHPQGALGGEQVPIAGSVGCLKCSEDAQSSLIVLER
jgi:3-oxoacyl-[acyl-carrier-protein] synthase II